MRVKVSGRGQICLPAVFRRRLKINAGDFLKIVESGESLILYPMRKKQNKKQITALLERTSGMWSDLKKDGAKVVRELRQGSSRDVWGD